MFTVIIYESILAITTLFGSRMIWQLFKRDKFLKHIIRNRTDLSSLISIEMFDTIAANNAPYVQRTKAGYVLNVGILTKSDLSTNRRLKLIFGTLALIALAFSGYISVVLLIINFTLFLLIGILPLDESGQRNALDHLLTLATILYKWRQENENECDEWIAQTCSLKELYSLIQEAK